MTAAGQPSSLLVADVPLLEDALKTMRERVSEVQQKIKPQDLAGCAGPPGEET
jgi:hypothetical protein